MPWCLAMLLYVPVVKDKVDIPRSKAVRADKVGVSWRPLRLGVPGQHALDAEGGALDVLHG